MPLSEHVYCVAVAFKVIAWGEQQFCIRFCIKLEHSSVGTVRMIQKAAVMGSRWLDSSRQCAPSYVTSDTVFVKTSNHPGDLSPLQPRFGTLRLLAGTKTKITFERGKISNHQWDSGKYNGATDGDWENCVRSQGTWKGTEVSLSCVQCFLYLVSSSVSVPIFCIVWLDTFWANLVYSLFWSGSQDKSP